MNKILSVLFFLLFITTSAFAADMRFAQVDGVRFNPDSTQSVAKFDELIKDINSQKNIEFVVFTGNNISNANEKSLKAFLKKAKKLKAPFYVVIGNKDVNKRKGLSKTTYMKVVRKHVWSHKKIQNPNYIFEKNNVIFLVADGAKEVVTLPNGYYKPETLSWIDKELNYYSKNNVIIIQHFPLIPPSEKESYYTFKADEYLQILNSHKNVKAIVSGHFGVNNEQEINGIIHISTEEAPKYRIIDILDYDTDTPTFWSTLR